MITKTQFKDVCKKAAIYTIMSHPERISDNCINDEEVAAIILDDLHNAVCDEVGELADDWYIEDIENEEAYKKCEEDINDLVVKFIEENGMKPTFSKVTDIKPYFIK